MSVNRYVVDNTDSSIRYSTGWNEYTEPNAYGGTVTSTFSEATASFQFSGMHVSVSCMKLFDAETNQSSMFNVDDGPWIRIISSESDDSSFTCWSSGQLESGLHTLNVKNVKGGTPLRIDKINYEVLIPELTDSTTDSVSTASVVSSSSSFAPSITTTTPPNTVTTGPIPSTFFSTSDQISLPSSTIITSSLPSTSNRPSASSLPSADEPADYSTLVKIGAVVGAMILITLGFYIVSACIRKRNIRRKNEEIDAACLPSHVQDLNSDDVKKCHSAYCSEHASSHSVPHPEAAHIPPVARDVSQNLRFLRKSDLQSSVPVTVPTKRSRLRDTMIFLISPARSRGGQHDVLARLV